MTFDVYVRDRGYSESVLLGKYQTIEKAVKEAEYAILAGQADLYTIRDSSTGKILAEG